MIEQCAAVFAAAADAQRQLAAAALGLARRRDLEHAVEPLAQQCFEVARERDRLRAERIHACATEDRQRNAQRRERENRRIRQLPAFGTGRRREIGTHAETRFLVVAPPAGKARPVRARVALVHERAGDGARARVQVFVAAPHGEIAAAVVQLQREVAGRVREVEADDAALLVGRLGDFLEIERLARAVLHAGQHHERDARTVLGERALDRGIGDRAVGLVAFELDQRGRGIEAVEAHLRFDRVAIGRERMLLDQDRRPLARRPVEADHHEVQVRGQRVHRDDFARLRADERREILAHERVIRHPRMPAVEMRFDGELFPVVELGDDRLARRARHEPERIAGEIGLLGAVGIFRDQELVAEWRERVGGVLGERARLVGVEAGLRHRRHRLISSSMRRRSCTTHRTGRSTPSVSHRAAGAGSALRWRRSRSSGTRRGRGSAPCCA